MSENTNNNDGVIVTEAESKVLQKLAVKLKKRTRGYKIFVVVFLLLGILTALGGYYAAVTGVDSDSATVFVIAALEIYMAVDGIKQLVRWNYRKAVRMINQYKTLPSFNGDGVNVCLPNGKVTRFPWKNFTAYTRTGTAVWAISDGKRRQLAFYANSKQISAEMFSQIMQKLKENGIPEETVD